MDQSPHLNQRRSPDGESIEWEREFSIRLKRARLTVAMLIELQGRIEEKLGQKTYIEYIYDDPIPKSTAEQEAFAKKAQGISSFPRERTWADGDEVRRCTSGKLDDIVSAVRAEDRLDRIRVRYHSDDYAINLQLGSTRKRDRGDLYLHCIWSGGDSSPGVRWLWEYILRKNHLWLTYKAFFSATLTLAVLYIALLPPISTPVKLWWDHFLAPRADYGQLAKDAVGGVIGALLALYLFYRLWDHATRGRLMIRSYNLAPRVKSTIDYCLRQIRRLVPDRWATRATESVEAETGIVAAAIAFIALGVALLAWLLPK